MEFRILGPLDVRAQAGSVPLAGPREHRLLAMLLLSGNRIVPLSRLIDGVWDDHPPATAKRQVQNALSALRTRLCAAGGEPSILPASGSGYQLRVPPEDLDAERFQSLVTRARELPADRRDEQARLLRSALELWRGPALAGVTGREIRAGAARYDEQRLTAYEWCLDLELQLGRHEALTGELTELVAAQPLRERLVAHLMVALYRSARQAEALQAYHDLRERLTGDLGVDPSKDLQDLQLAILRGELPPPAGDTPVAVPREPRVVPRQLPAVTGTFVGRSAELTRLDALAEASGHADTIVISAVAGTAGIGKTALAVYWAHRVAARFPDGQLYVNLRGFDPSAPPMSPGEAIRGFLDAFEVPPERIPAGLSAQSALYRSLLAGRRVLVVLDNARDTEQVRPLLPGSPGCLALTTSRHQLTGLVAIEGAQSITLDLLSPDEARDLLGRRVGLDRVQAAPEATDQIIDRCARLPLALTIVAARAAAHPTFPLSVQAGELTAARAGLSAFGGSDPDTDVRGVFSWSYHALGSEAAALFRLLGLHPGPDIGLPAAAALAGLPVSDVRPLMSELADAHLVAEHLPKRFTQHDLLRAYAAELTANVDSDAVRHAAIRRLLDHYLHTAYAADRLLNTQRDLIDLEPPAPDARPAQLAGQDEAQAWFLAEHHVLLAAVELAAENGYDIHTWQLAWALAASLDWRGHWRDEARILSAALEATRRLGNQPEQARAHRLLAQAWVRLDQHAEARHHLQQALELSAALGDLVGQGQTHHFLSYVCERQGSPADALGHAQQSLLTYRKAGHRPGEANALNAVGWYHTLLGEHERALAYCRESLALQQELGNRAGEAAAWDSLGYAHHHLGDHGEAARCYQQALKLSRAIGDRYDEAATLMHLGDTARAAGDVEGARDAWRQALVILDRLGHADASQARAKLNTLTSTG